MSESKSGKPEAKSEKPEAKPEPTSKPEPKPEAKAESKSESKHQIGGVHRSSEGATYWIRGASDIEDVTGPGPVTFDRWQAKVGADTQIAVRVPPNYDEKEHGKLALKLKLAGGKTETLTLE